MARTKTVRAPRDIDHKKATRSELVSKLREFTRYAAHLEQRLQEHQKRCVDLENQVHEQQDFMVKQQAEIMAQDLRKSEEFHALEARLGSIEDAVTVVKTTLTVPD